MMHSLYIETSLDFSITVCSTYFEPYNFSGEAIYTSMYRKSVWLSFVVSINMLNMLNFIWAIRVIITSVQISRSSFIRTERINFSHNFHNTVFRCCYVKSCSKFVPHTPITTAWTGLLFPSLGSALQQLLKQ